MSHSILGESVMIKLNEKQPINYGSVKNTGTFINSSRTFGQPNKLPSGRLQQHHLSSSRLPQGMISEVNQMYRNGKHAAAVVTWRDNKEKSMQAANNLLKSVKSANSSSRERQLKLGGVGRSLNECEVSV